MLVLHQSSDSVSNSMKRNFLTLRGDMDHQEHQVDQQRFCCPICLDLLKDPVTTSCGHSFCRSCIKHHWDSEGQRRTYSCPQCRETFRRRPVLKKNTMLADLVEEMKKTGLQAAPADHCNAGPEDVACDVCAGRKLKAHKSCLQCLASFCEEHLQTHFHAPPLKKHKLVEPSKKLQENICSVHDESKKMFCRTDQQSICYLCVMDQHKGHDTVSAVTERTERQRELQGSRQNLKQRIQHRQKRVRLLKEEVCDINRCADGTEHEIETFFSRMISQLMQRRFYLKQQAKSQKETEVSRVRELQEKLEQEISELKRKDEELEKLSHTQDHNQFLQDYPSVSQLREPPDSFIAPVPLKMDCYTFENVTAALTELRDKLQDILRETWPNTSDTVRTLDVSVSESEPRTRAEFLQYSRDITLDPNTAFIGLLLSDGNKKVKPVRPFQPYPDHPERFVVSQVQSKESLTGRCYWEVEVRGQVLVAVSYKNICRAEPFRSDQKSFALLCLEEKFIYSHKCIETDISGPLSPRVGVYLDHSEGILSFYSVAETMTLLCRIETVFTEPLHAGIWSFVVGSSAELCKPK